MAIAGATREGREHCPGAEAIMACHIDEAITPRSVNEIYAKCSLFATIHFSHP